MPQFLVGVGVKVLAGIGVGLGAAGVSTALAIAVGSATVGLVSYTALRGAKLRSSGASPEGLGAQQILVRSTSEPVRIVYGEAVVSGPLVWMNTAGADGEILYSVIALTGHEIDSFIGFYLDDKYIPIADVDTGATWAVDADSTDHRLGPVGSDPVLYIHGYTGTSSQTVDSTLDSVFSEWGSNHRGRGVAYLILRMRKIAGAEEKWQGGPPQNVRVKLRGKKVYDPRLDSSQTGGLGAHRLDDPSTWAYSVNNALCTADYLIDSELGAGFDSARIDYVGLMDAADDCDASAAIPTATTQPRFTCNGVLSCHDVHRENVEKLLSSFGGTLRYYNGLWRVAASTWPGSSSFTLNESHLIGPITYRRSPERTERYNAVRGQYIDPDRNDQITHYLPVEDATLQSARDDGLELWKELDLPMTNDEYTAQRLAFRMVEQASRTGILVFPTGYNGLNIAPGDRGTVSIAELGWSSKTFRCVGLRYVDMVGVELVLKEDDSAAYADPAEGDYGTRTGASGINFPGVPLPTVGVVVDPTFSLAIGDSWIVGAGSVASVSVGGGEGGGNALVLTNAASTTQAVYNARRFDTSPGEIIAGQLRIQRTADVQSVVVRTTYYRADTLASLGTADQDITALILTAGTYYTVPFRQRTPTSYTLDDDVRVKARLEIRMVPDGSGTATATVSSFNASRFNSVGTNEIDPEAATEVYQGFDAGPVGVSNIS